jgi:outer membrane protein OmpA-like peptidoglycan-associated protein
MNFSIFTKGLSVFAIIIAITSHNSAVFSQKNFTLYSMNETSQALNVNPGFKQKNRFYLSLPLGMQSFSVTNSGFTLNDFIEKHSNDDSLTINPAQGVAKMAKLNRLNLEVSNELFAIGFKVKKKNYVSFGITNRLQTRFSYAKDLFNLVVDGNGNQLLGQRAALDGLGVDLMSYMEYAVGYNRNINDKLTVGGRLKFISGVANLQTKKSQLGITTDATTFDITLDGSMAVNSSNLSQFADTSYNPSSFASSAYDFKNFGLALDLGGSYQLTEKIQLNASLLDVGFIKWKTNISNYVSSDVNYTFKGVDLNALLLDSVDVAKVLSDTLSDIFNATENTDGYSTALRTKFYAGGRYDFNKYIGVNALLYNEIVAKKYSAGLSLAVTAKLRNWLSATVNYSAYGRSYNNIGFGLNLKGGPIQFYVMTDNLMVLANYQKAKHAHICFGMNVVIGPRKDKDKDGTVDKKDDCPTEFGEMYLAGCPDKDRDSIPDHLDDCPDVPGIKAFKGCPDLDKDGVQDKNDSCPDIAGLAKFNGCPDRDNDSVIDKNDSCPDLKGLLKLNGCPDKDSDGIKDGDDACPDVFGLLINNGCPDKDQDGIIDDLDNCPEVSGPKENIGCPWPDTDQDGLLDKDDACPTISGPVANKGCPYVDTDGDGILDSEDKCPTLKGIVENNGCPKIEEEAKEILKTAFDNLEFNSGNAVIKATSLASLDDLAGLLIKKKDWKLQISGHTDNVGNDQTNLILSKKRSEAIKTYLTSKGVAAERLRSLFFGETQPLESNDTEAGRQKNRRVEMTIVFE